MTQITTPELLFGLFAFGLAVLWVRRRSESDDEGEADEVAFPPGRGYEKACEDALRAAGWKILPVAKARDGGADIHARKNGVNLVVQCKHYKRPVGFKAVQEVYVAADLYDADHKCVVAPNGFSADAEKRARELGVKLLHHDKLQRFARGLT